MAAAAYPCVTGTDHRTLGPPAGHLRSKPVSLEMPLRSGPRNCGQSDPCAAGSREATPAAPAPIIQPRRVYIQAFSMCVEKNNTFACSITRYSGLKICRNGTRPLSSAGNKSTSFGLWRAASWSRDRRRNPAGITEASEMAVRHKERHRIGRIGWLRAAVLGANDGILSTASLVLGVATAHATHGNILVAGVAGLVAGTMSMAAGEYVSVHSQADTERADLK